MDSGNRTPSWHRWLDAASGALLLLMTVLVPWLFAGTVSWSFGVLCAGGGVLGLLLGAKHWVRWQAGYSPDRWLQPKESGRWALRAMAVLTLLYLDYLFVSWLNARATLQLGYRGVEVIYQARTPFFWLPTTYDAPATLRSAAGSGALALIFWSARDWLLGRSRQERRAGQAIYFPPERIRRLLWVLCSSSAVLAVASIAQRLDGSDRLLWLLRVPSWDQVRPLAAGSAAQLWGPFPTRAAGAAYFNLVWPVALGFWWSLRLSALRRSGRTRRLGDDASVMLLPATALMVASPLLAGARGSGLVTLGLLGGALLVLSAVRWPGGRIRRGFAGAGLAAWLVLIAVVAVPRISSRLQEKFGEAESGRRGGQAVAARMASDAGVLGLGAGSFPGLAALYRQEPDDPWPAHASNDWREFRVTVGLGGTALLVLLLGGTAWVCRNNRGLRAPREFVLLLALALAGALIQATLDSPFQVPAVAFLFLMLAAVGMSTASIGKERMEG